MQPPTCERASDQDIMSEVFPGNVKEDGEGREEEEEEEEEKEEEEEGNVFRTECRYSLLQGDAITGTAQGEKTRKSSLIVWL